MEVNSDWKESRNFLCRIGNRFHWDLTRETAIYYIRKHLYQYDLLLLDEYKNKRRAESAEWAFDHFEAGTLEKLRVMEGEDNMFSDGLEYNRSRTRQVSQKKSLRITRNQLLIGEISRPFITEEGVVILQRLAF